MGKNFNRTACKKKVLELLMKSFFGKEVNSSFKCEYAHLHNLKMTQLLSNLFHFGGFSNMVNYKTTVRSYYSLNNILLATLSSSKRFYKYIITC